MASDDFPLIDSPHSQPHRHAHTRHFHSPSPSSPTKLTNAAVAGDTANGDYYTDSYQEDGDDSPDPNISGSGVPTPNPKRPNSTGHYHYNKRLRSTAPAGADHESGTEHTYRSDYRKDREEWSDTAIACLLEAYTEKFNQLNRGNLRGRDWEEVAEAVSERCSGGIDGKHRAYKSVEQCKNKIDNLKKRYKVELQRMTNGGLTTSHWHWFKSIEAIIGNSVAVKAGSDDDKSCGANSSSMARQPKSRYTPSNVIPVNNLKPKPTTNLKWRRVVFKVSGSALAGNCQISGTMLPRNCQSIDPKVAMQIAREVATACRLGVEVAIVVGGRNFFCGNEWVAATGFDRPTTYQIGMMATLMNSLLLQSAMEKLGVQTRVQSAFSLPEVAEPYNRQKAIRHLEKGRVVIFGGVGAGTGNPLFTTDTAAALRASELNAEAVLKGTNVNGVYDCHSGNNNVTLDHISFSEFVSRGITNIIDMMALAYCEENGVPVVVFNLHEPGNISRALCGDQVGTLIDQAGRLISGT